jgi:hypothetical protein
LGIIYVSDIGPVQKPTDMNQLRNAVHDLKAAAVGYSHKGGVAFYSVLKATEKVPYDSAILLFTGRAAEDEDLAQITTETLTLKRCKVSTGRKYKIWEELSNNGMRLREYGTYMFSTEDDCPLRRRSISMKLHSTISQMTVIFILAAVRT